MPHGCPIQQKIHYIDTNNIFPVSGQQKHDAARIHRECQLVLYSLDDLYHIKNDDGTSVYNQQKIDECAEKLVRAYEDIKFVIYNSSTISQNKKQDPMSN